MVSFTRMALRSSVRMVPLAVLASFLVLTGCRTYGNEGYDSGPKTHQAFEETIGLMETELTQAQSDLQQLEAAAETMDTLRTLTDQYRSLVESHEAALEGYRGQAERLAADDAYRSLHRQYGAIVKDRQLLRLQYGRTVRQVWATVRDTATPRTPFRLASSYSITPVQYPRVEGPGEITMADALREAEGVPGLRQEE